MERFIVRFAQPRGSRRLILFTLLAFIPMLASAQARSAPDPVILIAAQRKAMAPLAFLDGVWRGTAWIILPSGQKETFTQTERIGPFLDGSVKVMEGRSYGPDGKVVFNAFAILSYNSVQRAYSMHSYAQGNVGDFAFTPSAHGYTWDIPAGPMTIRYSAEVKGGVLHEVGDRILPGKDPVQFFEMNVKRVGDANWPAAGAVGPQ